MVRRVADALATMVVGKAWLNETRAINATRDACDRTTVAIAADADAAALRRWLSICALRDSSPRRLFCGRRVRNLDFFAAAIAALAGVPIDAWHIWWVRAAWGAAIALR